MVNRLKIGVAGLGTVGQGVVEILQKNADLIEKRAGQKIEIAAVSARNQGKDRGIDIGGIKWYESAVDLASDKNIDLVVELIGGADGVAYDLCKKALSNGKHVVTANKALIAEHGFELAEKAEKKKVSLMFEAAVAGGIPALKSIREGLSANKFVKAGGILNGTCNYILSAMEQEKRSFDDILKEAQELGYAEADPSFDVDGIDTAHKLSIITSLAYGSKVNSKNIYIEGIRNISPEDIEYAKELGYSIKLLGICNEVGGKLEQRVHPCLVSADSEIAGVCGVTNAVFAETDALGKFFTSGAGAGKLPTASSVVADIIDVASGRTALPFGIETKELQNKKFVSIDEHEGEYYVLLNVKDVSGVLASITTFFSKENVCVEKMLQKANKNVGTAKIALTTDRIKEKAIKKALKNIGEKEYVIGVPHLIRIEDF